MMLTIATTVILGFGWFCPISMFLLVLAWASWGNEGTTYVLPPPYHPPEIPVPPDDSGQPLNMQVTGDQLVRCVTQKYQLAKERLPGWQYQVALTYFEPQLAALRREFDRMLVTPVDQVTVTTLDTYGQYSEYLNDRIRGMERTLAEMSQRFGVDLPAACEAQAPDPIRGAVNAIIRDCRWIYAWGVDQQHYRGPSASALERPLGPREAEHIFRQVETLVADLKRKLAGPTPQGSLLFRAEFYFPKKEEVDRPVLAVVNAPPTKPATCLTRL